MALPSSPNQISMSQIATEFGGSAPHNLSEYYGDGNAPASGEIQMGADFHGTSASITHSSTCTIGGQEHKTAQFNRGFVGSNARVVGTTGDNANANTVAIGSLSVTNIVNGGVVEAFYGHSGVGIVSQLKLEISIASTNWTSVTITHDSNNIFTYQRSAASSSDNQLFIWQVGGISANNAFPTTIGSTCTVSINA